MSDQEHEQRDEETSEEREETMKDLEPTEEQAEDVRGGRPYEKTGIYSP